MANKIIFWQNIPSHHMAGAIEHFCTLWPGEVYGVYDREMSPARKASGWKPAEMRGVSKFFLDEQEDPAQFVEAFIKKHNDAIHILGGFRGGALSTQLAKKHLFRKDAHAKIGFITERPSDFGRLSRKVLLFALYRFLFWRYGKKFQLGLAMGKIGVDSYAKLGCRREILFPFMYQCNLEKEESLASPKITENEVKFLYIGNFSWHKGTDLLKAAVKHLPQTGWKLSLVGGGGSFEAQTLTWAEQTPQVSYLGRWESDKVVQGITEHDVCIIPSRYDGWGMVTNESLQGGAGAIVSTAAGSCDLVAASGAGKVITAGSVKELAQAMELVISDNRILLQWKEKARDYLPLIQKEAIGQYLFEVIQYTFLDPTLPHPKAKWL